MATRPNDHTYYLVMYRQFLELSGEIPWVDTFDPILLARTIIEEERDAGIEEGHLYNPIDILTFRENSYALYVIRLYEAMTHETCATIDLDMAIDLEVLLGVPRFEWLDMQDDFDYTETLRLTRGASWSENLYLTRWHSHRKKNRTSRNAAHNSRRSRSGLLHKQREVN